MTEQALLLQTLADIRTEVRSGFAAVTLRLDSIDRRIAQAESRVSVLETRIDDCEDAAETNAESLTMSKGLLATLTLGAAGVWSLVVMLVSRWLELGQ